MQDADDVLERLERWYAAQCNGDWEHTYGITIETLDNPGWNFKVELRDSYLSGRIFKEIRELQSSDHREFFHCSVKDDAFTGACPPNRLREVISIFLHRAEPPPAEQVEVS